MAEMWITMGPQHPMTHGLWTLRIKVDGETVTDTEPELGYIHRGVEKICENRTFIQITPYCDRLCYASAMTWAQAYIYAAEDLLGAEVPERAEYIRLISVELQRIASHLMWLGAYCPDVGNLTVFVWCLRDRELFLDLLIDRGGVVFDCGHGCSYFALMRGDSLGEGVCGFSVCLAKSSARF